MNEVCQVSRSFRVFAIGRSLLPVSDLCLRNSCLLSTCASKRTGWNWHFVGRCADPAGVRSSWLAMNWGTSQLSLQDSQVHHPEPLTSLDSNLSADLIKPAIDIFPVWFILCFFAGKNSSLPRQGRFSLDLPRAAPKGSSPSGRFLGESQRMLSHSRLKFHDPSFLGYILYTTIGNNHWHLPRAQSSFAISPPKAQPPLLCGLFPLVLGMMTK